MLCSSSYKNSINASTVDDQFNYFKKVISLCNGNANDKINLIDDYLSKVSNKKASNYQLLITIFWKQLIITDKIRTTNYQAEYHFQIDENYQVKFNSHPQATAFNGGSFKVSGYDPHKLVKAFQTLVDRDNHSIIIFKHPWNPASHSLMEMNCVKPDYKLQNVDAITINLKNKQVSSTHYKFPKHYKKVQNMFIKLMY